jgi:hypothetical protein
MITYPFTVAPVDGNSAEVQLKLTCSPDVGVAVNEETAEIGGFDKV